MEALFKRFYRPLYLYALTFLRDEDQAKDITGGVFQTVWEMLRERHDQVMDRYTHLQQATAPLDTEEEVMDFERRIEQVKEVIELLPEPEKSILKCTYYKKMTYKETAELLHTSVNMIHKRMSKVFRMMREKLKKEYE